jgi:hypothetical protein
LKFLIATNFSSPFSPLVDRSGADAGIEGPVHGIARRMQSVCVERKTDESESSCDAETRIWKLVRLKYEQTKLMVVGA